MSWRAYLNTLYSSMQPIPDYEARGPLQHSHAAASVVVGSMLIGAAIALTMNTLIGVVPTWAAIFIGCFAVTSLLVAQVVTTRQSQSGAIRRVSHHHRPPLEFGVIELRGSVITSLVRYGRSPLALHQALTIPEVRNQWLTHCHESSIHQTSVRFMFDASCLNGGRRFMATISPLTSSAQAPHLFGYMTEDITEL